MNKRQILLVLAAGLLIAAPSLAAVVSSIAVPTTRAGGYVVTAADWNSDVGGLYASINSGIVAALNKLTTKGDIYAYDGGNLQRQGVGSDGQVLTADSAQANGIKWAAFANTAQLTTKGDLLTYGASPARLGVGTNGHVLTADSAQTLGIKWAASPSATVIPTGTIIAWSPAAAGSNDIPSGWLLCDGTSSTPNLIGRFILGGRPSGSSSPASSGGYGIQTVDANGAGATTAAHTHTQQGSFATAASSAAQGVALGGVSYPSQAHTHAVTISGATASTAPSTEPADYVLVYIMKS